MAHVALAQKVVRWFGVLVIAVISLNLAIYLTNPQEIHPYGQTVGVGVVRPGLSWRGPGEATLGSGMVGTPTVSVLPNVTFPGWIRPLVNVEHITRSTASGELISESKDTAGHSAKGVGRSVVYGWLRYFEKLGLWAGGIAMVGGLLGGFAWAYVTKRSWHTVVKTTVLVPIVTMAVLVTNIGSTYYKGQATFTDPGLAQKLFNASGVTVPPPVSRKDTKTQIAVLGDSTQSGEGLEREGVKYSGDWVCDRSPNAAATDIAVATGAVVTNLACSGATVTAGVMGTQLRFGHSVSPQLSSLEAMTDVKVIYVGVGADDVGWAGIVAACLALESCNNQATMAIFNEYLQQFVQDYYHLLFALQDITAKLKHQTSVIIDLYYNPFGTVINCPPLEKAGWGGLDKTKVTFLVGLLGQLNNLLAQGAKDAGFLTAAPNYTGHEFCTNTPYVQGFTDKAFHPDELGQQADALADIAALPDNWHALLAGIPNTVKS